MLLVSAVQGNSEANTENYNNHNKANKAMTIRTPEEGRYCMSFNAVKKTFKKNQNKSVE